MTTEIDIAVVALVLALIALALAIPLLILLVHTREPTPLLGFMILMLCVSAVLGSLGRAIDVEPGSSLDYWIRIGVVSMRVAVVGAMLYDIRWLRKHQWATTGDRIETPTQEVEEKTK
jgi:hypothetical protein